jgi:hypothetical protein
VLTLFLLVQIKDGSTIWRHEEATHNSLGSFAKKRDPYERKAVYAAPSTLPNAGEGLFAKRDLAPRELVAYFGLGIK